jgi:hypothetical protein
MSQELNDAMAVMLAALDGRMRLIATEVVQAHSTAALGAVKVKPAAKMLELTEWRVRRLINKGRIAVVHPTPHTIRIPLNSLRRFLQAETCSADS